MTEYSKEFLVIGSDYLSQHIILELLNNEDCHITFLSRRDPDFIYNHPDLERHKNNPRIETKLQGMWDNLSLLEWFKSPPTVEYDAIIHAPYIPNPEYARKNPIETMMSSVTYTTSLLDTLRRLDFNGLLIHVSSSLVYGKHPELGTDDPQTVLKPFSEELLPNPIGVRPGSIYAQEQTVGSMCKGHGIKNVILRPGTIFGNYTPFDKCMAKFAEFALKGEPIQIEGDGQSQSRDFTNVQDVVSMIRQIAEMSSTDKRVHNQVFNIGSAENQEMKIFNLANVFTSFLANLNPDNNAGKQARVEYLPWRNYHEEKGLRIYLDTKKAKDILGYRPWQYIFYAVVNMIKWNALYVLGWDNRQMMRLENSIEMGGASYARVAAAANEELKETGVIPKGEGSPYNVLDQVKPELRDLDKRMQAQLGPSQAVQEQQESTAKKHSKRKKK